MLERAVPQGGAEICGNYLPEGTIVGINPWAVQRDGNEYKEAELW